jgi:hypothetical protein
MSTGQHKLSKETKHLENFAKIAETRHSVGEEYSRTLKAMRSFQMVDELIMLGQKKSPEAN